MFSVGHMATRGSLLARRFYFVQGGEKEGFLGMKSLMRSH